MSETATFIRSMGNENWRGDVRLYKLSKPVQYHETFDGPELNADYVVVSAVNHAFAHETYIFPADSEGNILNWLELEGSYRGGTSHEKALNNQGYTIANG